VYVQARTEQGWLLFVRESTLLAQPFDAHTLELTGEPKAVADRVRLFVDGYKTSGRGDFSVSGTGVLVYSASENNLQQLTALDRTGKPTTLIGDPDLYFSPRLSPDDRRLAVARIDPKTRVGDIHVVDLAAGTSVRLTFSPADDFNPVWSPDGRYIVWGADRGGKYQLFRKLATGVGQEELLREASTAMAPDDWSADGRHILYREFSPQTNNDLWLLPLDGDKKPFPFLQTTADEPRARFSPDGHLIGYLSNESGSFDTYVQTFPASGSKWQVSSNGGGTISWRTDGKELYYLGNGKLWAVEVKRAAPFELGARRTLFDHPSIPLRSYFAASGDGQRFVFAVNTTQRRQAPLFTVVLNWAAEIEADR
jgi:Tol biopolymer transport system component